MKSFKNVVDFWTQKPVVFHYAIDALTSSQPRKLILYFAIGNYRMSKAACTHSHQGIKDKYKTAEYPKATMAGA